jgi:serpin B
MAGFLRRLSGLFGGNEEPEQETSLRREPSQPGEPESFADDNNDFALAMYGRLRQKARNLFFSPFSIRTALSMTQAGARGETAAQMIEALRISSSGETPHVVFADIIQRLKSAADAEYEMVVANSLWGQEGAPLQPAVLDVVARHYDGGVKLVDFRGAGGWVDINRWVEDKTGRR